MEINSEPNFSESVTKPSAYLSGVARIVPFLVASLLFFGVAHVLDRQEAGFSKGIEGSIDPEGNVRPIAEVAEMAKALKLITIIIDSSVHVERNDPTWRGTTRVVLECPVRYFYGIDLEKLETSSFAYLPLLQRYVIRVPLPRRIGTEVMTDHPTKEEVSTTGTRFGSLSGEAQMSLARRELSQKAKEQALSGVEQTRVRDDSRIQLEKLVRRFVGGANTVEVVFVENN